MLFFDRRRRLSRVLNPDEVRTGTLFSSQTTTPSEPAHGGAGHMRNPNLHVRCSSYACRWFPSLTLADCILIQAVLCLLLTPVIFAILGVHAHFVAKERLGYDIVQRTRAVYTQAKHYRPW